MDGSAFDPGFDDRREIWRLLGHLDAAGRIAFLRGCCEQVSTPGVKTVVTESGGSVNEVYWDLLTLSYANGLSLERIGEKLVGVVRGRT